MERKHPNIVFVLADQLTLGHLGYAGNSHAQTPHIDRLQAQSTSFPQAVSVFPICGPYRACLYTGKYPSATRMFTNDLRCRPDDNAIGHVLNRAGYRSALIGKWHLYNRDMREEDEQFVPPGPYRLGFDDYWAGFGWNHFDLPHGYYYEDTPGRLLMDRYQPDFLTDLAERYLESRAQDEKPFALFLSYEIPHDPWDYENCPPEYRDQFRTLDLAPPASYGKLPAELAIPGQANPDWQKRWDAEMLPNLRGYHAMVACLDACVGRLLAKLDALALAENTIVVFTSDHGELFGCHGQTGKLLFYDESVRVPFLIRWPGRVPMGTVSDANLNTPDIMPTLLELAEVPCPDTVQGVSYAADAIGFPGTPERPPAFMQALASVTNRWRLPYEWRALRDARYTYVKMRYNDAELLFDNIQDPNQLRNLAHEPGDQDLLEAYRREMARRMAELGDNFESSQWYEEHWAKDKVVL